ncbi:hypothetical protein CR513_38191, partial [Mucuna pruriens]
MKSPLRICLHIVWYMILRTKNQSPLKIPKWKDDANNVELDSLSKQRIFGPIVNTPKGLNLHLMNAIIVHLYDSLGNNIYMKLLERFNVPNNLGSREDYSITLNKSLYEPKQSRRVWYNCLDEYSLKEGVVP